MSDLKPCPFCGCDDVERIGFDVFFKKRPHIKCHGCGADVYDAPNVSPIWHKHDSMVQTWNERHRETCKNISDPPEGFLCSSCGWGDFDEPSHLLTAAKYTGRDHGGPNFCPNCGAEVER